MADMTTGNPRGHLWRHAVPLLAPRFGITGIAFSCAIGWSVMLLFEIPYYFHTCKKRELNR